MLYRRKIILALLEIFDNRLEKIALQKLLFLLSSKQVKPAYYFIPYHFGCYSISASADLKAMVRHNQIEETNEAFSKKDTSGYIDKLTADDRKKMLELKSTYGKMSSHALMKHTYLNYQYYAINSKKAKDILTSEQYQSVINSKPVLQNTTLFTIGYEGVSLEEYLNKLIKNDIKVLVDVRNNPVSMKFGFSKSLLSNYCEMLGIEYLHVPELGIKSEFRKELNNQQDYDSLFNDYRNKTLTTTQFFQENILALLMTKKRIALTCFESDICQCHRKPLAESIQKLKGWNYDLLHI